MSLSIETPESQASQRQRGGVYLGEVQNALDPEQRGRLKVWVPSINARETLPTWAEPMGVSAGPGVGHFVVPAPGSKVLVMFLDGNPERPLWMPGPWTREGVPAEVKSDRQAGDNVYPTRRLLWGDERGLRVVELESGELAVAFRDTRKLSVKSSGGTLEIDTKPDGKVKINRPEENQGAARKGDSVNCGTLVFAFQPGPPATLSIVYTDPEGIVTTLAAGSGTIRLLGKISSSSSTVKIGD